MAIMRRVLLMMFLAGACSKDATSPPPITSIVGTWNLVGFTDMGIAAATTGTCVFRANGTLSVNGTVTFPGEPTEPLAITGTYVQNGNSVALTIAGVTATWTLTVSGNQLTLTENGPAPANTITLRGP